MAKRQSDYETATTTRVSLGHHEPLRFNMLLVGESAIGKRSFVKSMLKSYLPPENLPSYLMTSELKGQADISKLNIVQSGQFDIPAETGHVRFHLYTVPGYGDSIDNFSNFEVIEHELSTRLNQWRTMDAQVMTEEERLQRDERIHCVLYFMGPHKFKNLDREFIRRISVFAPIVPIISKADAMTFQERSTYLQFVQSQLNELVLASSLTTPVIYDFCEQGLDEFSYHSPNSRSTASNQPSFDEHCETNSTSRMIPAEPLIFPEEEDFLLPQAPGAQAALSAAPLEVDSSQMDPTSKAIATEEESVYRRLGSVMAISPAGGASVGASFITCSADHQRYFRVTVASPAAATVKKPLVPAKAAPQANMRSFSTDDQANLDDATACVSAPSISVIGAKSQSSSPNQQVDFPAVDSFYLAHALTRIPNIFAIIAGADESGFRTYPWGILRIDDENISDFRRLQHLVFEQGIDHLWLILVLNLMTDVTAAITTGHLRGMKKITQAKMMEYYRVRGSQHWYAQLFQKFAPSQSDAWVIFAITGTAVLVGLAFHCFRTAPTGLWDRIINQTAISTLLAVPFLCEALRYTANLLGLTITATLGWYLTCALLRRDRRVVLWNRVIAGAAAVAMLLHRGTAWTPKSCSLFSRPQTSPDGAQVLLDPSMNLIDHQASESILKSSPADTRCLGEGGGEVALRVASPIERFATGTSTLENRSSDNATPRILTGAAQLNTGPAASAASTATTATASCGEEERKKFTDDKYFKLFGFWGFDLH